MVRALVSRYDTVEMGLSKGDIDDGLMERQDRDGGDDCSDQEFIWGICDNRVFQGIELTPLRSL